MDVNKLLDQAKDAAGVSTDKGLSEHLGLSHGAVSNWRKGRALPDVVTCEKLAVLCGIPAIHVIAGINEARAISAAEKKVWRRLAAAIALSVLLTPAAYASATLTRGFGSIEPTGLYIMRNDGWPASRVTPTRRRLRYPSAHSHLRRNWT
ncbi:helix-turn-helix domain-containing protein [Luteimonas saliphila]|uniref:helix-turn-helix domain-containing protein n=1 Tax=Luteimonas saliphila TaxID=2804919 RepID=UPI00192DD121|nr:helix-turn-helix transcriptional regulator [Luteimonas saliphila]